MKLRPQAIFKALRLPLLVAVAGVLLVAVWFDTAGVPRIFVAALIRSLGRRGVSCEIGALKAGVWRGVRMEKVHVWDGDEPGQTMFSAERLKLRLRRWELLRGRLVPHRLAVDQGRLFFPMPPDREHPWRQPLVFDNVNGVVYLRAGEIDGRNLSATLQGLPLRVSGRVTGFEDMLGPRPEADDPPSLSWRRAYQRMPERLATALPLIGDFFARQQFIAADSIVDATFHLDWRDFTACKADLRFQFSGISIRNVPLSKVKGNVLLADGQLSLPRLTIDMGLDTFVAASAEYDWTNRLLSGSIDGVVAPQLFFRLFERPMPKVLAEMSFPTPPRISLSLAPSPIFTPREWRLDGTLAVANVVWERTYVRSIEGDFSRDGTTLDIHRLDIVADGHGRESVSLRGAFDERERTLTGEAVARIAPDRIMRLIPPDALATRRILRSLHFHGQVPTLTATLEKARWHPFDIRGQATIEAENIAVRELKIKKLILPVVFGGQTLQTAADGIQLTICGRQSATLHATVDIAGKTFSLRSAAEIFPPAIYQGLELPSFYLLDELETGDRPVKIACAMDNVAWDFSDWRVSGSFKGDDLSFGEMNFANFGGDFEVAPGRVALANLQGESANVKDFMVPQLSWDWSSSTLELALKGQIDPLLLSSFVDPASRSYYQSIWQPFDWGESDPTLHIDSFNLRFFGSGRWSLAMAGNLADQDLTFNGIPIGTASADIKLDLPRRIEVTTIRAQREDAWLHGEVAFELGAEPILTLNCEGVFDPVDTFGSVAPRWREALADIASSADTRLTVDGQFYLKGKLRPQIDCRMEGSRLAARGLVVNDYTADWQLHNHELKWRISRADLCGGALVANGYTNAFTNAGKIDAQFKHVDLSELLSNYRGQPAIENLGKLNGQLALTSARSFDREETTLVGDGKVKVREGELYRTPIVESLVSLIGLSKVGKITALDAELEFRGDHLVVPRFATNGTILALRGDGAYHWAAARQGVDFTVRGEVLRATSLIPLLTRPLSWFFEAQLTGPLDNPKWRMRSPLRALMPGGDNDDQDPGDFDLLPPRD